MPDKVVGEALLGLVSVLLARAGRCVANRPRALGVVRLEKNMV